MAKNRNQDRESAARRGYDRTWQKIRAAKRKADPLCERHLRMDQVVQMNVVHHKDGNPWNRSWDNLESLCNDCHEYEEDRMKKAKIGADGIPTNPSHPWS